MASQRSVRLRRWSFALGTSIVALGAASTAQAQCSPDPTRDYQATTCTGTDPNGLSVNSVSTRVVVASGATVRSGSDDAAIVTRYWGPSFDILGQVDGGTKTGLLVTTVPYFSSSIYTSIEVKAGAEITGSRGFVLASAPGNYGGEMTANVNNAGRITGTTSAAIVVNVVDSPGYVRTLSLTNTGTITGVGTAIDTNGALGLNNTGTIVGSVVSRALGGGINSTFSNSTIDTLNGSIVGDLLLGAGNDTGSSQNVFANVRSHDCHPERWPNLPLR